MRIKLAILFLLLAAPAYAQTGVPKTITQLNTEINTQFPDNSVGAITPFIFRQLQLDMVASSIPSSIPINIKSPPYNATCNGTADDTASINSAIDAANIIGNLVYVPTGNCKVSSSLHTFSSSAGFYGDGGNASIITTTAATGDVVTITAPGFTLHDLRFNSTVTRTANAYVNVSNAFGTLIRRVYMLASYIGISNSGTDSLGLRIEETRITSGTGGLAGILINTTNPCIDAVIQNVLIDGISAGDQPTSGIEIDNAGDIWLDHVQTVHAGNGLYVHPTAQTVQALFVTNSFFDSGSTSGMVVRSENGSTVQLIKISNSWFATSVTGITMSAIGSGTVLRTEVINSTIANNSGNGFLVNTTGITDTSIIGGCIGANVGYGVAFQTGVTKFQVIGARIGPCGQFAANGDGIGMLGANSEYLISGNDLTSNTTGIVAITPGSGIIANNNMTGNTTGMSGITPSATISCIGNIGGADACSTNAGFFSALSLTNSQNAATILANTNTNAGAGAEVQYTLTTNAGTAALTATSTAGGANLNVAWGGAGPTQYIAQNATGRFTWSTGVSPVEQMALSNTGELSVWDGNVALGTSTKTLILKQGANGTVGTFVCTSGGDITVGNTNVSVTDNIIISLNTAGGTISTPPAMKSITGSTGFHVLCATNDTATYNYAIIKNAS